MKEDDVTHYRNFDRETLEKLALAIALRFHISDVGESLDDGETDPYDDPQEIYENLEDCELWEPFEDWGISSVENSIWNLANDITMTFAPVIGLGEE